MVKGDFLVRKVKKKIPFFTEKEGTIKNLQYLSNNSLLAYSTGVNVLCIRNSRDSQLKWRIPFPASLYESRGAFSKDISFFFNKERLYSFSGAKIFINNLKSFSSKKEGPFDTSIVDLRFSSDNRAIHLLTNHIRMSEFHVPLRFYAYESSSGKRLDYRILDEHHPQNQLIYYTTSLSERKTLFSGKLFYLCSFSFDAQYVLGFSLNDIFRPHPHNMISFQHDLSNFYRCITISHAKNGSEYFKIKNNFLGCALSLNNLYLIGAQQNQLEIWDIASKKQIGSAPFPTPLSNNMRVSLVLSPNASPPTILATIDRELGQTIIWQVDWLNSKAEQIIQFSPVVKLRFFKDSKLFFQKKNTIYRYDINTRKQKKLRCKYAVVDFDLSHDDSLMIKTERKGLKKSRICLWDLTQKKKLDQSYLPYSIPKICMSPNGKFVACCDENNLETIYAWEIKEGKLHLLWKIPKKLEVQGLHLQNVRNLSYKNNLLLSQLQKKP
ncbi:hypothetical protein [Candidatus Protochlamydia sp. R18]|uniref:hypothetical protein n=1 Tax=Candidatus Protochlamydia sp. R18 TaxID=1353977 RepID=UPI0005A7449A|nr:hypothetical protein [Candidatus Protochlamydia sp. R18]